MTPVTIKLCECLGLNPVPVLIAVILNANIGAAATPLGWLALLFTLYFYSSMYINGSQIHIHFYHHFHTLQRNFLIFKMLIVKWICTVQRMQ